MRYIIFKSQNSKGLRLKSQVLIKATEKCTSPYLSYLSTPERVLHTGNQKKNYKHIDKSTYFQAFGFYNTNQLTYKYKLLLILQK